MSDRKYSKLSFDTAKIPSMLNVWCEENLIGEYSIEYTNSIQRDAYTIKIM